MLNSTKRLARQRLDQRLSVLHPIDRFTPPPRGWLRAIRDALGMSGVQFARRLGVAWQSMDDLERSEAAFTITLASLRRAADALDCDLVYALVPRTTLEDDINDRAAAIARTLLGRVDQTMTLEAQQVAGTPLAEKIDDYIREHLRERDIWDADK